MVGGLDVGDVEPPPVLIGALAPHMLRLAGRLADGTITGATGPRGLAEHVVPSITKAAADAGRPPPRIVAAVVACITDDPDAARRRIEATSKPYATMPAFKAMLDREGVSSQVDIGIIGDEATAPGEGPAVHRRRRDRPRRSRVDRNARGGRANPGLPQEPARRLIGRHAEVA